MSEHKQDMFKVFCEFVHRKGGTNFSSKDVMVYLEWIECGGSDLGPGERMLAGMDEDTQYWVCEFLDMIEARNRALSVISR